MIGVGFDWFQRMTNFDFLLAEKDFSKFANIAITAKKILEIFNKEYPHLAGYANVIDNYTKYSESAIDDFSDSKKLPQIAFLIEPEKDDADALRFDALLYGIELASLCGTRSTIQQPRQYYRSF